LNLNFTDFLKLIITPPNPIKTPNLGISRAKVSKEMKNLDKKIKNFIKNKRKSNIKNIQRNNKYF